MNETISTSERVRMMTAKINEAEAALTCANALATDEIRAMVAPKDLHALESGYARTMRALNLLHKRLEKAMKAAQSQSGGGIVAFSGGGK